MKKIDVYKYLEEHSPDCKLAYHPSKRSRWIYTTVSEREDLDYNHRSVLQNEVVLDLDAKTKEENFEALRKIVARLGALGIKHSVWESGGKGFHVHTFWKRLGTVKEQRLMKDLLSAWLTWRTGAKVDTQLNGNHLVRLEYGYYEKTYPKGDRKLPINAENHFVENEIPEHLWGEYATEVLSWALRRLSPEKKKPLRGVPICLRYIMSQEFKKHRDGTKRALFVIASYHRKLSDDALFELLTEYNSYYCSEKLSDRKIKSLIRSVRKHKGRPVGCRYRHELLREVGAGSVADACEQKKGSERKCCGKN